MKGEEKESVESGVGGLNLMLCEVLVRGSECVVGLKNSASYSDLIMHPSWDSHVLMGVTLHSEVDRFVRVEVGLRADGDFSAMVVERMMGELMIPKEKKKKKSLEREKERKD